MYKNLLLLLLGIFPYLVFSQTSSDRKNDIMIDPIFIIAGPILNVSYERLLNEDAGIGINALANLDSDSDTFSQISPYYRMYFGKKFASGFFVEGFVPITTTEGYRSNYDYNSDSYHYSEKKYTTIGLGIGFGGKWVVKRNIVFEASTGIGRRFGNGNYDNITGKGTLGIGYRF